MKKSPKSKNNYLLQHLELLELEEKFQSGINEIRKDFSITEKTSKDKRFSTRAKMNDYRAFQNRISQLTENFGLSPRYSYWIDSYVFFKPLRLSEIRPYSIEWTIYRPGLNVSIDAPLSKSDWGNLRREITKKFNDPFFKNKSFPNYKQKPRDRLTKSIELYKEIQRLKLQNPKDTDDMIGVMLFDKELDDSAPMSQQKKITRRLGNRVKQIRKVILDELKARFPS